MNTVWNLYKTRIILSILLACLAGYSGSAFLYLMDRNVFTLQGLLVCLVEVTPVIAMAYVILAGGAIPKPRNVQAQGGGKARRASDNTDDDIEMPDPCSENVSLGGGYDYILYSAGDDPNF